MRERELLLKPAVMALNDLNLYYITAACEAAQNVQSGQDETSLNRKESTAREAAQNVQSGLKTAGNGAPEITLTGNTVIGKGRPIVLVHGNGEDHHLFDTEIRQLAEAGFTVYAPDSRGHGKSTLVSDEPVTEYHYADMAEDIYQFIKALGLKKLALYGHSDGGIIALLLEISHPGTLGIMAASGTNLSPQGLIPSFIEEYSEINKKEEDPLITLMLTEPHIDPESLKKIRIPVLVTAGDNDLILRSETEKIAAALPDSEMVIVEDADHGSYIMDSEIMGKLLLDFLQRRWC
ncbi:Lysophospholipase, alpha-beta hydrolase superfamily [Sarcina sp. DSM 11001]|uniref:alpha/beta fold hydrolase n=1 Tax=Sarcina sp. DSM 11001 TaxID=1798184 RepID=UPI000888BB55|nr:alpha/beta hydrolase [Sarcina sp. DSM 11001]SDL24509.1 Lysophospholipase, alpha-beta hydrolase superfamily [Sarcina sp. DSM 11001]